MRVLSTRVRGEPREAQISRFKASFAYCASRRRVFGRPITVACHFPLSAVPSSFFLFFLFLFFLASFVGRFAAPPPRFLASASFSRLSLSVSTTTWLVHVFLPRTHASRRHYFGDDFSKRQREQTGGSNNDSPRVGPIILDHAHVGWSGLVLASPQSPRAFPRSFTRFPFIRRARKRGEGGNRSRAS